MLTKIDCINIIQLELSQGKITADLYQEFSVPEISRLIGSALDNICMKDSATRATMAKEYVFDAVLFGSQYVVNLSPLPLSGAYSFEYIKDDQTQFVLRTTTMANAIDVMRGGFSSDSATLFSSSELRLSQKPNGQIRTAYIPNIYLLDDDDELIMAGTEMQLIAAVISFIQNSRNPQRAQEMTNNGRIDAKP